jgi:hypothetical protein
VQERAARSRNQAPMPRGTRATTPPVGDGTPLGPVFPDEAVFLTTPGTRLREPSADPPCRRHLHQVRNEWASSSYPIVPGARNSWPGLPGGPEGDALCRRRCSGRRLLRGLVPHLPLLPQGGGAVLHRPAGLHLQQQGKGRRDADTGRLLLAGRGRRELRPARGEECSARPRHPAALRGHHHLLADATLEAGKGPDPTAPSTTGESCSATLLLSPPSSTGCSITPTS